MIRILCDHCGKEMYGDNIKSFAIIKDEIRYEHQLCPDCFCKMGDWLEEAKKMLCATPTADVQEVVRCKDCKYCKHWYADKGLCYLCHKTGIDVFENGFCSYGKKMDGEKEKEE